MNSTNNTALIVGANGIAGRSIANLLQERGDWQILTLSRKPSQLDRLGQELLVDLQSPESCYAAATQLRQATHIFYAARSPQQSLSVETEVNSQMLKNLILTVCERSNNLKHISLMHGTKWYGSTHYAEYTHYKTPAQEDDPRHHPLNYYHLQQDFLQGLQSTQPWTWSALRPHTIWGFNVGYPHNIGLLIAAYATISKYLKLPLYFPGSQACYDSISQATEAGFLAKAALWSATNPNCSSQAFNIVNSDFFRWRDLWPVIADYFDIEIGPVKTMSLTSFMEDKEPVWQAITQQYHLRETPFSHLGRWGYADGVLRSDQDDLSSTVKCRQYGFQEIMPTVQMCLTLFSTLNANKIIP